MPQADEPSGSGTPMVALAETKTEVQRSGRAGQTGSVEEWTLTEQTMRLWTAASVGLSVLGLALFAVIFAGWRDGGPELSLAGWKALAAVLLTTALTLPLYAVHEWIHGLTMSRLGSRPTYGWGQVGGLPGYLFCTAHGARFSRRQYVAIALMPALVVSSLGILAIAFLPWGGWLVVPLAFHFGGCVGDFWAVGLVLRRPRGTVVEDLDSGVRFHLPVR